MNNLSMFQASQAEKFVNMTSGFGNKKADNKGMESKQERQKKVRDWSRTNTERISTSETLSKENKQDRKDKLEANKEKELKAMEIIYSQKSVDDKGGLKFTQDRLKEAVIWSEILGKPVSKRRKRH